MSKYNAVASVVDGVRFDSKAEARRYVELKGLARAGVITGLELQPRFLLQDGFEYAGKRERKIEYVADFRYYDLERDVTVVEDVKGMKTDVANGKGDLLGMERDLLTKHGISFSGGWSMPARRNKGATLADVRRAKALATGDGVKAAMILLFTALNAMGWGKVRLQRLKGYVDFTLEAIKEGYVTAMDLMAMLHRECGVELTE